MHSISAGLISQQHCFVDRDWRKTDEENMLGGVNNMKLNCVCVGLGNQEPHHHRWVSGNCGQSLQGQVPAIHEVSKLPKGW